MSKKRRVRISWPTAFSLVGGMSLVGWAVQDVLSWWEKTALIAGVVLIANGFAMAVLRAVDPTNRETQ